MPSDRPALRSALRAVVDRRDPEGLLALGAPPDEYDPEAADLARLRSTGGPFTATTVAEVWERRFGPHSGFVDRASRAELAAFAAELEAAATDVATR
ncbi:hypothetical protein [Pseudonocardia sp. MH-G8]|uniref:hypothetical protein n=1 Tax=Pseudonocardia sp. MH-G8 TaxID=1854588 RepID=UPI000B9FC4E7|nr:hypothetical protein [Pseudonocardia sp. MH-G8]OZM83790.1 hypothetical protein CFP66_04790 [Pseudonocardia sp. MH-G8]